ncbi:hypothetical protein L873DRAFT_1289210 [Choiromyces venosus 120613-1]|uniref:Uncharacterized protein n=1 Tax=Choiromyces venosus 120613-1 TaxID=1336337 RepID=A0A3N4JFP4_9PEZI|nr:hypothetical protein L873DRAFT_1289210 [Choiromyces venosus 120613-1]
MFSIGSAAGKDALRIAARKDPELYVLMGLMCATFGVVGFYFSRKPTMAAAEEGRINVVRGSAPWNEDGLPNSDQDNYKYKYYPDADYRKTPNNAPGALHSVIIPDVNLPKHLHEKYNKYGKDNY